MRPYLSFAQKLPRHIFSSTGIISEIPVAVNPKRINHPEVASNRESAVTHDAR